MRKAVVFAVIVATLPLLLVHPALAGSSTDAALALGAFAVFNQLVTGQTIFQAHQPPPVMYAPPPPVVYAPPPPVVYAPSPPVVVYPEPYYAGPAYPTYYPGHHRHWRHDEDDD